MKNYYKPILFSTPMVQAILQGRKTQTRRTIHFKTPGAVHSAEFKEIQLSGDKCEKHIARFWQKENWIGWFNETPKYNIGDILWVRETFGKLVTDDTFVYAADVFDPKTDKPYFGWKPSIHMPKAAARVFLYVTNVRVERLQDISEADAIAEGVKLDPNFGYWCYECYKDGHIGHTPICEDVFFKTAKEAFRSLWISINGKESWEQNPFVWVYDFEEIEKPKDFI